MKIKEICAEMELMAPLSLQEDYDNAGLQVGDPEKELTGVLLTLDVTTDV
ncbi:MAG: Nif3-like dinuclear metal center hexameric protein, partial [Paludibacteraceae bacterium]|nr:Nif3-like dinuclear metal center hexameric protein [Paludibacteraceae bacterium]